MLGIVKELGIRHECVIVHRDNKSTIHLTKHQVFHESSKCMDVKLLCQIYCSKMISCIEDNSADIMRKDLPTTKFSHYLNLVKCALVH